jgi:hypothetical protein
MCVVLDDDDDGGGGGGDSLYLCKCAHVCMCRLRTSNGRVHTIPLDTPYL